MPNRDTVYQWMADQPGFSDRYARAREEQADTLADDIVRIADDPKLDPNDKRVRVDARKWVAAKLKPKKYGEKLELGGDLGVTYRTSDDILGALNSILARYGVAALAAGGAATHSADPAKRGLSR